MLLPALMLNSGNWGSHLNFQQEIRIGTFIDGHLLHSPSWAFHENVTFFIYDEFHMRRISYAAHFRWADGRFSQFPTYIDWHNFRAVATPSTIHRLSRGEPEWGKLLKYSLIRMSVPWQSISKWWFITSDGCTRPLRWLCNGSWWAIGLVISVMAILFNGSALLLHPNTVTLDQFRSTATNVSPEFFRWFSPPLSLSCISSFQCACSPMLSSFTFLEKRFVCLFVWAKAQVRVVVQQNFFLFYIINHFIN